MINKHFFETVKRYCIKTIATQLFLFLLSLPIIVTWGIPISIMTLISTPLFGPALTIFLLISTFIFFCTLCSFPYVFLLKMLDFFVYTWDYFLSCSSCDWLFTFAQPHIIIMTIWTICNTFFLFFVLQFAMTQRVRLLAAYTCIVIILLSLQHYIPEQSAHCFNSKTGSLQLFFENGKIVIIDQSFFSQQKSADSWIKYTFIPTLISRCGHTKIDAFIMTKASKNTINALEKLMNYCTIQHIIIPHNARKNLEQIFSSLVDKTTHQSGIITSINEKYTLYAIHNLTLHIKYNHQKKQLEV